MPLSLKTPWTCCCSRCRPSSSAQQVSTTQHTAVMYGEQHSTKAWGSAAATFVQGVQCIAYIGTGTRLQLTVWVCGPALLPARPPHVIVAECMPLCRVCVPVCAALCQSGVEGGITQEQLLNNFRDDVWSNTCVMLLRFITSAEIKRRVDHFEPFVLVGVGGCQGHSAVQE